MSKDALSTLETSVSVVNFYPDKGLVLWKYKLGSVVTEAEALEEVDAISAILNTHFSERVKLLIDIGGVRTVTRSARGVFSSQRTTDLTRATALIMGSRISTVVGNLFISINPPRHPTRIFHAQDAATEWLSRQ